MVSTSGTIDASFSYDANGNQTGGAQRTTAWSSYNKPVHISKNGAINQFSYGPQRQLIYQKETITGESRETRYVGGIYEETIKNGQTEAVHYLTIAGHTIAVLKTQPTLTDPDETLPVVNSTHYLHQDHLDSVVMITDAYGDVVEKNHYDAFGKKRLAIMDAADQPLYAGFLPITDRSFTGHRYLKSQELIHMKGRVYDPTFGRFLSADPHIQSPLMSQSLNRYSYVLNNPLSLTDPSGYFSLNPFKLFKKIYNVVKKIIKKIVNVIKKVIKAIEKAITKIVMALPVEIRIVAAIAVAFIAPQAVAAIAKTIGATALVGGSLVAGLTGTGLIVAGAVGGFAAGLITTGSLKAALISGLTAAVFAGIGAHFGNIAGRANDWNRLASAARGAFTNVAGTITQGAFRGLTGLQAFGQSLAHGIVGGLSSKLSGRSFSKGLLTSFMNKVGSPIVSSTNLFISTTRHAIFAGGVSKLAGGSFSHGAKLGAMATFFNEGGGNVSKFFDSLAYAISAKTGLGVGFYLKGKLGDQLEFQAGGKADVRLIYEDEKYDWEAKSYIGASAKYGDKGSTFTLFEQSASFNGGITDPVIADYSTNFEPNPSYSVGVTAGGVSFDLTIDPTKIYWPW